MTQAMDERTLELRAVLANSGTRVVDFFRLWDADGSGDVDFDEFLRINDRFPMLFYPVLSLQEQFRARTLGAARWEALGLAYVAAQPDEFKQNLTTALRDIGLESIDELT